MSHIKIDCPACDGTGRFKSLNSDCTYCGGKKRLKLVYHLRKIGHLEEAERVTHFQTRTQHTPSDSQRSGTNREDRETRST